MKDPEKWLGNEDALLKGFMICWPDTKKIATVFSIILLAPRPSPVAQVKNLPPMQETLVWFLAQKDPLEKGLATHSTILGLPCGSAGKESACNAGDLGSIPELGRYPGERKGYPLQYSGLENSMDCIVYGVAKSRTQLSDFHFKFHFNISLYICPTSLSIPPSVDI